MQNVSKIHIKLFMLESRNEELTDGQTDRHRGENIIPQHDRMAEYKYILAMNFKMHILVNICT